MKPFVGGLLQLGVSPSLAMSLETSDATTLAELEDEVGDAIDSSTDVELRFLKRKCCPCIDRCDTGSADGIAVVEFEIDVFRDPKDLFYMIDPHSWAGLLGQYFTKSSEIEGAPPCDDKGPVCFHATGPCRPGTEPDPIEAVNPKPSGTPWCGLLHEIFKSDWNNQTATFENVLGIRTEYEPQDASEDTATGYRLDYRLCEALGHVNKGVSKDCGVEVDCGFARVIEDGANGAYLFGNKHVSFITDLYPDANIWAPIALEIMVKEAALATCDDVGGAEKDCRCLRDSCQQHRLYRPREKPPFCDY